MSDSDEEFDNLQRIQRIIVSEANKPPITLRFRVSFV